MAIDISFVFKAKNIVYLDISYNHVVTALYDQCASQQNQ